MAIAEFVAMMRAGGTQWQPNTNTLPWRGTSAGGGYSTVGDLLRFADALLQHAQLEEQITYPAAILVGQTIKRQLAER